MSGGSPPLPQAAKLRSKGSLSKLGAGGAADADGTTPLLDGAAGFAGTTLCAASVFDLGGAKPWARFISAGVGGAGLVG